MLHPRAALGIAKETFPSSSAQQDALTRSTVPAPSVPYYDAPQPTVQHCAPQLSRTRPDPPLEHPCKTSSDQQLPGHAPQHHPPGCDEIQQPVYPDLLDATVRNSTNVGKVQLLVPTKVEPVSLVMRQWGAGDRTKK